MNEPNLEPIQPATMRVADVDKVFLFISRLASQRILKLEYKESSYRLRPL